MLLLFARLALSLQSMPTERENHDVSASNSIDNEIYARSMNPSHVHDLLTGKVVCLIEHDIFGSRSHCMVCRPRDKNLVVCKN